MSTGIHEIRRFDLECRPEGYKYNSISESGHLIMSNADDRAVPAREAVRVSGVHIQTLRKWADSGKIRCIRTPSGQRRFDLRDLKQFVGLPVNADRNASTKRDKYVYARVSSSGQRSDLERQIESLRERFPDHLVVRDVASGLNFKRPGFLRLMDAVCAGRVEEVVVAHFWGFAPKTPNLRFGAPPTVPLCLRPR